LNHQHYSLPNHLARIFESAEFHAAAKEVGRTMDQFRNDVTLALKDLVKEEADAELKAYEKELGDQALTHALIKFKGDVEHSLKQIVAKHSADELAAHEEALTKRVLAKAKSAA
jgi:hypothetical protein